jgi:hypothetical protein
MIGYTFTDVIIRESDFAHKISNLHLSNKFSDRILGRCANVILAPTALITCALDTLMCLGAGLGAICTLGMKKSFVDKMIVHFHETSQILAEPYLQLLTAIAPPYPEYTRYNGLFCNLVQPLGSNIKNLISPNNNFLKRHVASRLTIALLVTSLVITKVIDGVIGVIAAPISLVMAGKFKKLNTLALNGLYATNLIGDLMCLSIAIINPKAIFSG